MPRSGNPAPGGKATEDGENGCEMNRVGRVVPKPQNLTRSAWSLQNVIGIRTLLITGSPFRIRGMNSQPARASRTACPTKSGVVAPT